ncbi:MAG: hypothetical protein MZU79_01180 [Anaerotruncus sp.]|nr:hypothetical protein [Anaerotruncus sp.]
MVEQKSADTDDGSGRVSVPSTIRSTSSVRLVIRYFSSFRSISARSSLG